MMAKQALQWSTLFVMVASVAAYLPGVFNKKCATTIYSPRVSLERPLVSSARSLGNENNKVARGLEESQNSNVESPSRRVLFRRAMVKGIGAIGFGTTAFYLPQLRVANAYTIDRIDPDEKDIYAEAQNMPGPLKILWVGSGSLKSKSGGSKTGEALSGVYKNLFKSGNEVIAVDLLQTTSSDYRDAKKYAKEQGYVLRYQQGDATKLDFADETFDAVVCSCFLSQPFDPVVVVNEIQRVLKPGGRFGFFEHKTDIDTVIVGKVFGEDSIIKLVAYPEMQNILAGVVRKL